jgi:alkylation response protein AidB-like acyl-CoA dehydrogenase
MDLEPNELQTELVAVIRKLCAGTFPVETLRSRMELGGAIDRPSWKLLAEAGVFSLRRPEHLDGVGLAMTDGVLLFQELGRSLVPGPLVASHLAATHDLVTGAHNGSMVTGLIEASGGPIAVEHFDSLDALVVLHEREVRLVGREELVASTGAASVTPTDSLTPVSYLQEIPSGECIGDVSMAQRLRLEGTCLTAALQVGIAGAATTLATEYAKVRHQFDRPIGSFQAVKHLLADMFARYEVARAAVDAAAATIDYPEVGDPFAATSSAKILAGEAARLNGKSGIQVHGGMGFTWEVDAQLYLKRAWVLDTHFGSSDDHADLLAAHL